MQGFGRAPELQEAKIQEVAARSAVLGKVVEKMLTKDPRQRISSAELSTELLPGRERRGTAFSDPLESLSGVSQHEITAVHTLRGELDGDDVDLSDLPDHVGGSVALLRIVQHRMPSVQYVRRMLAARSKLGSDAIYSQITEERLSMSTLPGTAEAQVATWHTNEWVGLDEEGDVVVYERWGHGDIPKVLAKLPLAQYSRWNAYRYEARAMLLDALSRRTRRVMRFTFVIDLEGADIGHRKCIPYIKEFVAGDFTRVVPTKCSGTYLVRSSNVFASLFALFGRMGLVSAKQQAKAFLIAGPDPFTASAEFAVCYERSALPSDIGGEVTTGTDGHCCLGVKQPTLCDKDAVWAKYLLMMSSIS